MSFSNFNANINCKHFKCCYHDADDNASLINFIKRGQEHVMKNLLPWWNEKGCHGNDNENDATATYRF